MIDARAVVGRMAYKPGWSFKVAGPGGHSLCVFARTVDSLHRDRQRTTQHQFVIPDDVLADEAGFLRWVRDRLLLVEQHECCEFFTVDGRAPFWPNHEDEGSPYDLVERWEHP